VTNSEHLQANRRR